MQLCSLHNLLDSTIDSKGQNSGLKVRCVENGWLWDIAGLDKEQLNTFEQIAVQFCTQNILGSPTDYWITIIVQHNGIDTEDRIVKGAMLMRALIGSRM